MAETINGSNTAVQNRVTSSFTPNVGGEYGGRYEGPKAKVLEKMQELILAGYAVNYECDQSPVASVTFKTPTGSNGQNPTSPNVDYTDSFQVTRNTVQKELLMSDHPYVASLTEENLAKLKGFTVTPPPDFTTPAFTAGADLDEALYLWELWSSGVRSVEVKQPVLRVTRVTNPLYDAPFDLDYVDRILFSNTMIADSGVPANFAIGLVSLALACSRRTTLDSSGYAVRTDSLKLKFGWLKDAPTSETVGTTKNQYILEYKFGLYDTAIFGEPI